MQGFAVEDVKAGLREHLEKLENAGEEKKR